MDPTAQTYMNEPVRYPPLHVTDLKAEGESELRLESWQSVTIPAATVHRTRAIGRTVNLCFEELAAETVFVEP